MEISKKRADTLIILELVSTILGIASFVFAIYILPYIMFGWVYSVPHFVVWLEYWYEKHRDWDATTAIFLPLLLLGMFFFYVARRINTRIEIDAPHRDANEISRFEIFLSKPHSLFKLICILVGITGCLMILGIGIDDFLANLFG